jgi:pimeloyl-ACP methyl ester carboxylesterase
MEAIAHTLAYDAAVMGDSTVPRGLLSRVTIPTLILTGDQTGAWSEDAAHALADTLPAAEHCVLAGQNHAVAWDVLAAELQQSLTRAGL